MMETTKQTIKSFSFEFLHTNELITKNIIIILFELILMT